MPKLQQDIMRTLYGHDVWAEFKPAPPVAEVQGWNGNHPTLKRLAGSGSPLVVDVGVWKGQSTITLANAMKEAGLDGCVIAVDTFLGSPEHWRMPELFSREHGRPDIYKTFLSNCWHAGVADYIVPMPQTSVTAALILHSFGIAASVVHIDAAHEYEEVLRDADEYWKILVDGGFLVGDDYAPSWPGVVKAAHEFVAKKGVAIDLGEPPKWIAQKKT